jgi:hypothetical protein
MTALLARDPRAPFELPGPLGEPDRPRRVGLLGELDRRVDVGHLHRPGL